MRRWHLPLTLGIVCLTAGVGCNDDDVDTDAGADASVTNPDARVNADARVNPDATTPPPDSGPGNPDAAAPDAVEPPADSGIHPDAAMVNPDAETFPDAEPEVDLFAPEGGEVRFEYMEWAPNMMGMPGGPGGRATATRVMAFFIAARNPERADLPRFGACNDLTTGMIWPRGTGTSTEVDVGQVIIHGGPENLTVPKAMPNMMGRIQDPLSRIHKHLYFHFGIDDTNRFVDDDASYDVILTGNGSFMPRLFEDAIWMPKRYTITAPAFPDPNPQTGVNESVTLTRGQPFRVDWSLETQSFPADVEVFSLTAFSLPGAGVTTLCVDVNTGTFTVPAAVVDATLDRSTSGTLLRGTLTHEVRELSGPGINGRRRIDMLGIYCYLSPFTGQ
jgi:hypothetical protein